ncbi:hypothetical protein Tco_0130727, partial [Tanacetum coccineum]
TATYGKEYGDDFDLFINSETYFPAIVYNDALTSNLNVSSEPTVSIYNAIKADIDFSISYSDFEDEDYTFTYDKDSLFPKLIPVDDLKPKPVVDTAYPIQWIRRIDLTWTLSLLLSDLSIRRIHEYEYDIFDNT